MPYYGTTATAFQNTNKGVHFALKEISVVMIAMGGGDLWTKCWDCSNGKGSGEPLDGGAIEIS